jgi:hypothetical protein
MNRLVLSKNGKNLGFITPDYFVKNWRELHARGYDATIQLQAGSK